MKPKIIISIILLSLVSHLYSSDLPDKPFIHVQGNSSGELPPDYVEISFIIKFTDTSYDQVLEAVNNKFGQFNEVVEKLNIDPSQITAYDIDAGRKYNGLTGEFTVYDCSRRVKLTLEDFTSYSKFVDSLHQTEGIENFSANFRCSQIAEFREELGRQAIQDAKTKAIKQAEAFSCSIGSVYAISETDFSSLHQRFIPGSRSGRMGYASNSASNVYYIPSSLTFSSSVNVIFYLEQN